MIVSTRTQKLGKEQRTHTETKWRWAGHIARMKDNRWTKRCTEWQPKRGKRSRVRPCRRLQDDITRKEGTTWNRKAIDRRQQKTDGGLHPAVDRQSLGEGCEKNENDRQSLGERCEQNENDRQSLGERCEKNENDRQSLGERCEKNENDRQSLGERCEKNENDRQSLGERCEKNENDRQSLGERCEKNENDRQSLGERCEKNENDRQSLGERCEKNENAVNFTSGNILSCHDAIYSVYCYRYTDIGLFRPHPDATHCEGRDIFVTQASKEYTQPHSLTITFRLAYFTSSDASVDMKSFLEMCPSVLVRRAW